jgi:hypothetical protein
MRRLNNTILAGAFLAVLLAPTIAGLCRFEPMAGVFENRALAKRPDPAAYQFRDPDRVAAFAQDWEQYYTDNFGLRKLLIGSYRGAWFHSFGISANPAVVVGESDGHSRWLYYEGAKAGDGLGLNAFLGKIPFNAAELAAIRANLARVSKLLTDNHIKFLVIACPDKQSIYPEYLPKDLRPVPGVPSRLEQMSSTVQSVLGAHYVDLRAALRQAKSEGTLYFPTDSHWNAKGALVAYRALMQALQQQDPTRVALSSSDVRWQNLPSVAGDLIGTLGLPRYPQEPQLAPILPAPDVPPGRRRGKVLVLHDSFFFALRPYFEFEFAEAKMVRGVQASRGVLVTQEMLTAEKPDVVVIESVERIWTL